MSHGLWLVLLSALSACSLAPSTETSSSDNLGDSCSSPLFDAIAKRVRTAPGPIPYDQIVTTKNGASSDPLIGGVAIFDATADLVAAAQHDVAIQTWRWDVGSEPTLRLMDGLRRLEARRRSEGATTPVLVRMLINRVFPQAQYLGDVGKQIADLQLDERFVEIQLVSFLPVGLGASHAKTVIVDGTRAIVMGANFAVGYASDVEWLDAGFAVSGEVAQTLFLDFVSAWKKGQLWTCGTQTYRSTGIGEGPLEADPCLVTPPAATTLPASTDDAECLPMLVATHADYGVPFPFEQTDTPQAQMFLAALANAKSLVEIQTPNLNERVMKAAIVDAVRRGVTVQLLLSRKFEETGESLPGRGGGNEATLDDLYGTLADLPDACQLLQARWYSHDGVTITDGTPPPNSHVKYLSVDGQIAIVGSANQDVQSWRNSHEVNVVVDSARITAAWDQQLFLPAWNRSFVVEQCGTTN